MMEYDPKIIPEGINVSEEHPVREFAVLVGSIGIAIVAIVYLLVISSDYLIRFIPVEKENEWFPQKVFTEIGNNKINSREDTNKKRVEKYILSLVDSLEDEEFKGFKFTITLLESDEPNAFITPGGHIFVTHGLLKTITSENALAMIIGHEMAHQYHRHTIKSAGRGIVIMLALMVFTGFDDSDLIQGFVGSTVGLTSMVFSRDQEREADATGVKLLVKRYRHASGSSEFFKKLLLDSESESNIPVFMSTHPGIDERILFLESYERENNGEVMPFPDYVVNYINQINVIK